MPYDDLIEKHARRVGLDPRMVRKFIGIESGGDPNNRTGSYKGLLQLSDREFTAHGGTGSIYDPEQNIMAGVNKIAREKLAFEQKHGRTATPMDMYGIHQQGAAGYDAHLANPDQIAWKSIRKYYSSDAMAKKAIWGNVPDKEKAEIGSVENLTSGRFTSMWGSRVEGGPEGTFSGRVAKSKARHEGIPEDAGDPKPKSRQPEFEFMPSHPAQFQVQNLVPNIQLAKPPL
jgi:hypothetical protein